VETAAEDDCATFIAPTTENKETPTTPVLKLVVCMAILTWLTLLAASLIRAKAWTLAGTLLAFGNRDNLPQATPFAGRAERTARNTLENFVLFAAIAWVAHAAGVTNPQVVLGAQIFVWSRVAFIPAYYLGIVYLRTGIWLVSIVGLAMMVLPLL
jgi:uncharacterized MAPEG superfamily protein